MIIACAKETTLSIISIFYSINDRCALGWKRDSKNRKEMDRCRFAGEELTLQISPKKEMNPIEGRIIATFQMIEGAVSPAEGKKCNAKWKEKLQQ